MRWRELSVEVDVEAVEAVSEIFGRVAAGTAVRPTRLIRDPHDELSVREDPAAPFVVSAHIADDASAEAAIDSTERALWHLQAFGLRPVSDLRVRSVEDVDWMDAWKEHYVAQRVGRVVITPSWMDEKLSGDEIGIVLDPGMAFGTGLHPTTRGCLELLQEISPMPSRLIDVGCGSGILALAALGLGVEHADACDTDPLAVEATTANAAANGLADRTRAWRGTLPLIPPGDPYPLVLANLVAAVLVELAPRLAAHLSPGGTLLASGIIEPRAGDVLDAMAEAGLHGTGRRDDGEWVSLVIEHAT